MFAVNCRTAVCLKTILKYSINGYRLKLYDSRRIRNRPVLHPLLHKVEIPLVFRTRAEDEPRLLAYNGRRLTSSENLAGCSEIGPVTSRTAMYVLAARRRRTRVTDNKYYFFSSPIYYRIPFVQNLLNYRCS